MKRIRPILTNGILVIALAAGAAAVIALFLAETAFDSANRLEKQYRWSRAETMFKAAVRLDPFNICYISGLADFYLNHSAYQKDKTAWLGKCGDLYLKAVEVNPYSADSALNSGRAEIKLFLEDKSKYRDRIAKGMACFKRAVQNDPNGFNILYPAGYSGMEAWAYLDDGQKEFVLTLLKSSLLLKPSYWRYIYPHVWQKTRDFNVLRKITPDTIEANNGLYAFIQEYNLWQFRKIQAGALDSYSRWESPEDFERTQKARSDRIASLKRARAKGGAAKDVIPIVGWRGKDAFGRNTYEGGAMYWVGTMDGIISLPKGESVIAIKAKGTPVKNIYPYMVVELDGKEIGETFVNNPEWKEYVFRVKTDGGAKVLSVTFSNDAVDPRKKEDRNLYIGEARVVKDDG